MENNKKICNYAVINHLLYDPEEINETEIVNKEETINFKMDRIEHISKIIYKNYLFHLKESEYKNIIKKFKLLYKHAEILTNKIKESELELSYKENRLRVLKYIKEDIADFILN
ncbi:hypothetical protein COY26_04545 [Candidatus Woesearchaeota archaeon CG_4_10_14_0_2_um_filter_33_10]|nr:MAG: hypothetical protein COV14_01685 [Candidatus Woesearchaeota archaeon CG10_big_fil_rev_8_21_14_0_10_33_12]PIZ52475.1 MAG: hypothetical protein COY26_04545 [Candidatus Woesearchaeota archaeon CG_4_10_14_0_2_um_filter_33_10]